MIELSFRQGSPEWKESRKKTHNASDYPSAQGVSKKFTRSALIAEVATGIDREFSPFMEKILENGHRVEEMARQIAEEIIGESLFPIVATSDDGYLGASSDGATMFLNIGWECKQWNADLAVIVAKGIVPETHVGQLDQQGEVFGFDKILFMVTDGTPERCVYCWHVPSEEAKAKIRPTWAQFDKDAAVYTPEELKPTAVADAIEELPVLTMQLIGQVTSSNLSTYQTVVLDRIKAINTTLVTDSDFFNAGKMVKFLDDGEKQLELEKSKALAQTQSIDELFRTIDNLKAEMRSKRLTLEKLVNAEKDNRKTEIVSAARQQYIEHLYDISMRVGSNLIPSLAASYFADAIKGLKSIDSMRDKVSVALANAKIDANAIADRIEENRNTVEDMSLLPDFATICTKPPDDFAALLAMRIAQRKESEEKRLEAERERISAEEKKRAEAKVIEDALAAPAMQIVVESVKSKEDAVIDNQDNISSFMASREFGKDANRIRAVLVEYIKWVAERGAC